MVVIIHVKIRQLKKLNTGIQQNTKHHCLVPLRSILHETLW